PAGGGHARGVGERQIELGSHWFRPVDLDFPRSPLAVVAKGVVVAAHTRMLHRKVPPEVLTVELERAALRAVRSTYADINGSLFDWQLQYPQFELTDRKNVLGRWLGGARMIELSRSLLIERGWTL